MSQKHFSTNCFKFKESLQIRIQKPCSNWIQYVPKKWQLHLIKQWKNVHLPLNKFCLVSVFGMLCLFCGCIIRIEKIVCFSHVMMMNWMSKQLSFWLFHLRTDSKVHRTRFKCRCICLDIFFYVDVHVFCIFLWMVFVCFFGFFFVKTHLMLLFLISCQEYFNAFFPVCLFISFRKMLFWNASQNMRLKIFWRQQLWHNKIKKDTKIRCQNKKEMSTGVSFFFLFLRMKTIFKQNIWRLFAFSINCASLVEIELEQK